MCIYGKYIKKKRDEKGYSQRKLGILSGVSNTTISRMENGETETPEINTLKAIESALDLEENEIVNLAYPHFNKKESSTKVSVSDKNAEQMANRILEFLIEKGEITSDEELTDEKRDRIIKLLDKAIDLSRL